MTTGAPTVPTHPKSVLRAWRPDVALGAVVAVLGLVESAARHTGVGGWLVAVGLGAAVGLCRRAPGYAVVLVWVSCVVQVGFGLDIALVQLGAAVVAYGAARYGSVVVVWASGLSIPFGATLAAVYVVAHGTRLAENVTRFGVALPVLSDGWSPVLEAGLLCVAVFALPWLAGLALRSRDQADRSVVREVAAEQARARAEQARARAEAERAAAQEVATLRAEQARLARDVHDVVGHSLAVILVQAESAQYLPDDDLERIRATVRTIATSARRSLQDIRQVLSSTEQAPDATAPVLDAAALIADLRAAGHDIRVDVHGPVRSLTSAEQTVLFRVLQEMLTNALRHGRRGSPVHVAQTWAGDLRLDVTNTIAGDDSTTNDGDTRTDGLGLVGMRHRLELIGGRFDVARGDDSATPTFRATAWIPTTHTPATGTAVTPSTPAASTALTP